jgi:FKBP-type peptidyl-prolyl cis-trans isomerase FkpA
MRYFILSLALSVAICQSFAAEQDSIHQYDLPDSVKAVSFITDVSIGSLNYKKEIIAGITTSEVTLALEGEKKERSVEFKFPASAMVMATGLNVEKEKGELEWEYNWKPNINYKLLIATAADSAGNFILYSGYIFLPEENKWKLIGTCRIDGKWTSIKSPASIFTATRRSEAFIQISNTWIQRSNGSWRNLENNNSSAARPLINPMPNADSVEQYQLEKQMLEKDMASGKTDVSGNIEGVYYRIIDGGSGKNVSVTDTVTVKYHLRIYNTTPIIDQAMEKPATFPLNRLIKAWQLAIPLVKTGGKIKLVIPSGFAYSIRTRAPKIPPNSILEFEIEVLDTKPAIPR